VKETKQQVINRLAADNQALREINSRLTTELAFANARLNEADHRARKLIRSANIQRNTETSARRAQMEAAKARAMALGTVTKVGG
jgi:hypothetical protein